jgi:hypothetical protein
MSACLPPCRLVTSRPRPKFLPLDPGYLMAIKTSNSPARDPALGFGSQSRGRGQRLDRPPLSRQGGGAVCTGSSSRKEKKKNPTKKDFFVSNKDCEENGRRLPRRLQLSSRRVGLGVEVDGSATNKAFRHNARDFLVRRLSPACNVVRNLGCDARSRGGLECAGKASRRTGFSTYEHGENER